MGPSGRPACTCTNHCPFCIIPSVPVLQALLHSALSSLEPTGRPSPQWRRERSPRDLDLLLARSPSTAMTATGRTSPRRACGPPPRCVGKRSTPRALCHSFTMSSERLCTHSYLSCCAYPCPSAAHAIAGAPPQDVQNQGRARQERQGHPRSKWQTPPTPPFSRDLPPLGCAATRVVLPSGTAPASTIRPTLAYPS